MARMGRIGRIRQQAEERIPQKLICEYPLRRFFEGGF